MKITSTSEPSVAAARLNPPSVAGAPHGPAPSAPPNLLPLDGEVYLYAHALAPLRADDLFARLTQAIEWRVHTARIRGRLIALPRETAWCGDAPYAYSGIVHEPAPWLPELLELKSIAEAYAGERFNAVLANRYRHGRDSVAWHADDERALGRFPKIASFSFGAVRRFQMRHKERRDLSLSLDLPHGSCLVMSGATQHFWRHQIAKTTAPVGPRVNLTFRRLIANETQNTQT